MAPLYRWRHYSVPQVSLPQPQSYSYSSPPPLRHTAAGQIGRKVFFQLLAGTVCIFVVAVLVWKLGAFFRYFTRGRILRPGKTTASISIHARTWYGWVPLSTHKSLKRIFKRSFAKIDEWTAWKTTRADYHWVWWDPGHEGLQKYQRDREKALRFLPRWLRSYEFPIPEETWNSGPPVEGAPSETMMIGIASGFAAGDKNPLRNRMKFAGQSRTFPGALRTRRRRPKVGSLTVPSPRSVRNVSNHSAGPADLTIIHSRFLTSDDAVLLLGGERPYSGKTLLNSSASSGFEAVPGPSTSLAPAHQDNFLFLRSDISLSCTTGRKVSLENRGHAITRGSGRYRAWAACMQMKPSKMIPCEDFRSREPAGSPNSGFLASFASEETQPFRIPCVLARNETFCDSTSSQSATAGLRPGGAPYEHLRRPSQQVNSGAFQDDCSVRSASVLDPKQQSEYQSLSTYSKSDGRAPKESNCSVRLAETATLCSLTAWEERFLDSLDRKLGWLAYEMGPGRKSNNFSLVANHWLNRRTWQVYYPVSRVSLDAKRMFGDPRFNVPYPEPTYTPRHNHPVSRRRRANPRIESWRAAVNKYRKESGARGRLKIVELFDGSVEDPLDGKIDTASWVLPKPPQGFELSDADRSAYYEGGYGWQETLEDWQKVRRGYRLRKAIFEGKGNRRRVAEVATDIAKGCRTVCSVITRPPATQRESERS